MPPRSNPSARQRRLGAELRALRVEAGLSTEQAAALLDTTRTVISSTEAGRHGVSPQRLRRIASAYGSTDPPLTDALLAMCSDRTRGWWEDFRNLLPQAFLDIAELEWHARGLRVSTTTHMPDQLQTEDYARALFRAAVPALTEPEVEARVAHRVQRHRALDRPDAPPCEFLVHESALRTQVGGPAVLRAQLRRLTTAAERDNVTLQAIPFTAGAHPTPGQAVLYAHAPVARLDTVLAHRTPAPDDLHHTQAHLTTYHLHLDHIRHIALPPAKTLDLIHTIASQLPGQRR
ncbi:helix-turn-helix domain-containing protein [Actinacidiphila epipremni]|uniref:Helix-turn-helix domain-containing protein n=1 Tax=Actinacidiphila epipremni TaxID=2053013 RepID=A0ABX0ZXL6_9ACTN|nr:Scr1 family TA system antitoxin-like transcriptional regulator [Actinacidiphila epipremni]NJP47700.1 helix-turn-helix domain-containing protein [Actinacidiphila epipremni]